MKLSIIIPIYNEEKSLTELYRQLKAALGSLSVRYEIIAINDGSKDQSYQVLKTMAQSDELFKVINLRRNYGQTTAMAAGIDKASGDIIIPLDADLQNDPADISKLLAKIDQGYDVVSGWRKNRQDSFLNRRLPSQVANYLISVITGVKLHDYGCTLKAYKAEFLKETRFYGEMHRFMPAYAAWHGAKITEIVVNHHLRRYGQTKYGISRVWRVILDLLVVKFLTEYSTKPMHFFGKFGYWSLFGGLAAGLIALGLKYLGGVYFISTPLPLLTVFLIIVGVQFVLMGLLAEILSRTYYESQNKPIYSIKDKINL